jgi:hypothetical protein
MTVVPTRRTAPADVLPSSIVTVGSPVLYFPLVVLTLIAAAPTGLPAHADCRTAGS